MQLMSVFIWDRLYAISVCISFVYLSILKVNGKSPFVEHTLRFWNQTVDFVLQCSRSYQKPPGSFYHSSTMFKTIEKVGLRVLFVFAFLSHTFWFNCDQWILKFLLQCSVLTVCNTPYTNTSTKCDNAN